jgi:hypothetical protein
LDIDGYNVPPAEIFEPKSVKRLRYKLLPYDKNVTLDMLDIYDNTAVLGITYIQGKEEKKIFITGNSFHQVDHTNPILVD